MSHLLGSSRVLLDIEFRVENTRSNELRDDNQISIHINYSKTVKVMVAFGNQAISGRSDM